MARPRSEDKRQAILQAATRLFAEEGLNAPTARIARSAGVAEGTLFTYFASKDELMNQLYLGLKAQLRSAMEPAPARAGLREQVRQAWHAYVDWGVGHPQERRVLAKLGWSDRITGPVRAEGVQAFGEVSRLLEAGRAKGVLRSQPPAFVGALMAAMADTTMDFIGRDPAAAEAIREAGFSAFWNAISHG
jgi:AcrR family transcriptional regulator